MCRIKETSIDAVTYRQYVELTQLLERKPDIQEILSKGDFTPSEEVSESGLIKVTPKVAIECTVPAALEEGRCTIWFSSVMLQGLKIHLSHEEILRNFMLGLHTSPEWETRAFLHVRENSFEVKLGQTVLSLSQQEAIDLCICVDAIFEKYKERIIETENVLETWNYAKEQVQGIDGYLLISVEEWVWRLMKQFSDEFDCMQGDSEWHIFERGFDRIRVGRGIYDHTWLWPKSSGLFIKNGEVDIIYEPNIDPSDDEDWKSSVGPNGIWTAEYTKNWLINDFIPNVLSYYNHSVRAFSDKGSDNRKRKFLGIFSKRGIRSKTKNPVTDCSKTTSHFFKVPLLNVTEPRELLYFVHDIQEWSLVYPVSHVASNVIRPYYEAIVRLAQHINFLGDSYIGQNLAAIDRRLEREGQENFGIEIPEGRFVVLTREKTLECLNWHAQRIRSIRCEDRFVVDLLSRTFIHIIDQENETFVWQNDLNFAKDAIKPLWEQSRFEWRYVISLM